MIAEYDRAVWVFRIEQEARIRTVERIPFPPGVSDFAGAVDLVGDRRVELLFLDYRNFDVVICSVERGVVTCQEVARIDMARSMFPPTTVFGADIDGDGNEDLVLGELIYLGPVGGADPEVVLHWPEPIVGMIGTAGQPRQLIAQWVNSVALVRVEASEILSEMDRVTVIGAIGAVEPLLDCEASWRRRMVFSSYEVGADRGQDKRRWWLTWLAVEPDGFELVRRWESPGEVRAIATVGDEVFAFVVDKGAARVVVLL